MKAREQGFVLMCVLAITSLVTIFSLLTWHKTSMLYDLVVKREQFYKNVYVLENIFNQEVMRISRDWQRFFKERTDKSSQDGAFIFTREISRTRYAQIIASQLSEKSQTILVKASLFKRDKSKKSRILELRGVISRDRNKYFLNSFSLNDFA